MSSGGRLVFRRGRRAELGRKPKVVVTKGEVISQAMIGTNRWTFTRTRWGGWWIEAWCDMSGGKVNAVYYFETRGMLMRKVKLDKGAEGQRPQHLAAMESNVFSRLGQLVAHLGVVRYDDGTPRQPGTITISSKGSIWSVTARDFDAGARLVASAALLDDALALMDLLLGAEDAPWEADMYLQARKPRGKK